MTIQDTIVLERIMIGESLRSYGKPKFQTKRNLLGR